MDNLQRLLLSITRNHPLDRNSNGPDARKWFTLVPGDPEELGGTRSNIGIKVKIEPGDDGQLHVTDVTTYNR